MNGGEYPKKVERGIRRIGPDRFEVRVFIGRDPVTGKVRSASRVVHSPSIREARRALAQLDKHELAVGLRELVPGALL